VEYLLVAAIVVLAVGLTAFVLRTASARQFADARASMAAELAAAKQDNKWLREEVERHKQALGSTENVLDAAHLKLRDAFQALAAEALKDNRTAFLDAARTSFERYQRPIADTLRQVEGKLVEAERDRIAAYSTLAAQVSQLGMAAGALSRALRTPSVRGRWGEMQLRRVVELAGMIERCDFDEQPVLPSDNGRLRPDLIVRLPGGAQIVVDAKAPLDAFLDAQEAPDDATRQLKLLAHARQVREHVDKLGGKAYWEQLAATPDMVVLFLPGETLFGAALQHDLTLIEHGLRQRVLLASPLTLIALLTTVAHAWRQESLASNYREVARIGKEFYERIALFAERFDDVRKRLDGAVQAYNEAAGSLEARVLVSARRLRELEVAPAAEIPTAEPVERVPRVLRQVALMGLPEGATTDSETEP
jgi:DNA recombination protein RmuC